MKTEKFYGRIVDKKFYFNNRKDYENFVQQQEDSQWEVTLVKQGRKRTDRQRNFYFGVLIPAQIEMFQERLGELLSKQQVHDFNKNHYFCVEIPDPNTGELIKFPQSTSIFSPSDFEVQCEKIRQSARQLFDFELPYPNENF